MIEDPGSHPAQRPGSSRYQRIYRQWVDIMSAWELSLIQVSVPRPVFNKHIKELLTKVTEDDLVASFHRFAGDITSGRVSVRDRPAWFVYYGRRQRYLRATEGVSGPSEDWSTFTIDHGGWDAEAT